jgi:hypothetical protein
MFMRMTELNSWFECFSSSLRLGSDRSGYCRSHGTYYFLAAGTYHQFNFLFFDYHPVV